MIAIITALAFTAATLPPCDSLDVSCFKLHLADQVVQIDELTKKVDALNQQLSIAQLSSTQLLAAAESANSYAQKIQQETRSHWYEAPALWFAIGGFVVAGLAIGMAAAFSHVTVH